MSKHFIIDGYNLLYALPEMPPGNWEAKRQALLDRLAARRPHGRNRVSVIFDSHLGMGDRRQQGEMTVLFTAGQSADDWIIEFVRETPNPRVVVVVTDDQGLRRMIRGTGAQWMSASDFWALTPPDPQTAPAPKTGKPEQDAITEEMKKKWMP